MKTPRLDLVSGAPYWPLAAGLLGVYPPLTADAECEVAVVGAGITGGGSAEASGLIFAPGYGGNGITFGAIAADVVRGLCLGKPAEAARLCRLDR